MTTKQLTKRQNRVFATVLTIIALAIGQSAWAQSPTTWGELQTALTGSSTDADHPTIITLSNNIVAASTDKYLNIPAGHHVIIDLNGHTINRNLTEATSEGQVFYVHGSNPTKNPASLTIRDSQGGGSITGGYTKSDTGGGAIYVNNYSSLIIEGGTITGNKCTNYGGGAISASDNVTVRMTGGSITGNVGNTSNNSAYLAAGAVYLKEQSNFYLSGGSITDNICGGHYKGQDNILYGKDGTGGIGFDGRYTQANRVHLRGSYTLSGNLYGNYENGELTTSIASDYLHTQQNVIVIEDAISPTAPAVITVSDKSTTQVLASGWSNHMTADPATCFTLGSFYNTDGKVIGLRDGNLVIDTPLAALWHADANHDGTSEERAYIITTTTGLNMLAKQVNGTDGYTANDFNATFFKLGNNIEYSGNSDNYTAIGTASNQFNGTFDGCSKAVEGIRINQAAADYQGLFGHIGTNGTVKNVFLIDAIITGHENTGAIVGHNEGTLSTNYYRACSVNSQGTDIGTGSGDTDGARSVHTLTLNDGITTPTAPTISYGNINYYAVGAQVTLDYLIPVGYVFNYFTRTAGSINNGNILTMAAQDATVSVYKSAKWGINNENDGSETKPYTISTDEELNLLSNCVNGTTGYAHYDAHDFTGKYFKVDAFIPYSEKLLNNFITIGTNGKEFNGTFDGNNKVIKSIRITDSSASHQGLFGYIGTSGTVKNVLLEDAVVTNPSNTSTVGVIAASNNGTLTDNYYFSCKINTDSLNIGTSGGDVNADDGAVSMHIITPGEGVVVTGSKHFYINDSSSAFDTGDNYYPRGSTITLSPAEGYLVGSGYTATKEKFKSNNPNLDPGSEEDVPVTENAGVYSFTVPAGRVVVGNLEPDKATYWHADDDHDGTSVARAYIISNTTGLDILASHVNYGNDCSGIFFRLGADIAYDPAAVDANGINFSGIGGGFHIRSGAFSGSFDGQGYTISGIRINRTQDDVGLFGKVANVGTVKNVILSDARITGGNYTGGIVGTNNGIVNNCIAVGTTIIKKEKYNYGVINGISSGSLSNNYYFNCGLGDKDYEIGIGKSEYSGDEYIDDGAMWCNAFPLLSTGINDRVLATNKDVADKDFTLAGRTLYKDGDWNTICLPFSLSAEQIAAHEYFKDVDIRVLTSLSLSADGTLTLNFTAKGAVTSIQAGTPYIIKWTRDSRYEEMPSAYDIRNVTFTGITITSTTPGAVTSADGKVTFQGTYGYTEYTNEDRSVLFLGTQNRLYYPQPALNDPTQPFDEYTNPWVYPSIGAFLAYFKLNDTNAPVMDIQLNFGDSETTEIKTTNYTNYTNSDVWYDLSGRKLDAQPTQKGIYIHGGRKVVIK